MFEKLIKENLVWFPEKEIGYYPVKEGACMKNYFREYQKYPATEKGLLITNARADLVKQYYTGCILDVGIGCGHFIDIHGNAVGYDVNPEAICWLEKKNKYRCLYDGMHPAATFWDSLEHIKEPDIALQHIKKWVFVSIPVFFGMDVVCKSKHYKKDEHYWYFTHTGIVNWFYGQGFEIVDHNNMETRLGRDGIGTYVFKRIEV